MKKLGKINISPEKVMRNEELLSLRGGYGSGEDCDPLTNYTCICKKGDNVFGNISYSGNVSKGGDCWKPINACQDIYPEADAANCY